MDSNDTTGLVHNDFKSTHLGRYVFAFRHGQPDVTSGAPKSATGKGGGKAAVHDPTCQHMGSHHDPVNCASGNFTQTTTDFAIPDPGPGLDLTRTYNSLSAMTKGLFGYGRSSTWDMHLQTATGLATITEEDGSQVTAVSTTTGAYQLPVWADSTLTKSGGVYTYVRQQTETFTFDTAGQLTSIADPDGRTTTLSYATGKLATVTDSAGKSLHVTFGTNGLVSKVTGPGTHAVSYAYDATDDLTGVTNLTTDVTTFGYGAGTHLLETITYPDGQAGGPDAGDHLSVTYDATAQVTKETDPAGLVTTFTYSGTSYSATGGTTTITDPTGNKERQHYVDGEMVSDTKGYGSAHPSTWTHAYASATLGQTSVTNPTTQTTTSTYDTAGNLLSQTNADNQKTTYTYNGLDEPLTVTDPMGVETAYTYDTYGNLLSTTVTADSTCTQTCTQTTSETVCETATCSVGSNTYTRGESESSTDPRGNVTTYTYTSAGQVATVTNPDADTTAFAYDTYDRLTCSVAPVTYTAGVRCPASPSTRVAGTTSATYSPGGLHLTSTDPQGDTTTYAYDATGLQTSVSAPGGTVTKTAYDADQRPTSVTSGSGTATASTTTTRYDVPVATCPVVVTGATYCDESSVATTTTVSYYDAQTRLVETLPPADSSATAADPGQSATSYAYTKSGEVATLIDAAGTTHYTYDPAGRLTQTSYPTTAAGYATPSDVCYAYDADGLRTSMTEAACTHTGSKTQYAYDGFARLVSETDTQGNTVTYGYDATGLLTCLSYPQASTADNCLHAKGGTGVVHYAYDPAGQMTSMTDWNTKTVTFGYDTNGYLTGELFPTTTSAEVNYAYDQNGQVVSTQLTDAALPATAPERSGVTSLLTYNSNGQVATDRPTGGSALSFSYDPRGELTTGMTTAAKSETYTYNTLGERTSVAPTGGPTTQAAYTPDQALCATKAGALPSCSAPAATTTLFGYNAQGERCFSAVSTETSATCASPPSAATTTTESWDQAGNLLCVTTPNATAKTCSSPGASHTTTYTYNGDGLRMTEKPNTGTTESFTWDTLGTLPLLLADGTYDYLYGPTASPIEAIAKSTGARSYLVFDNQGDRAVLKATGSQTSTSAYASYGTTSASPPVPIGYQGAYTDPDGLLYLINRYYDPSTGQFLSVDPAVSITGQPYSYATNDPVNGLDPLGLCTWWTLCTKTAVDATVHGAVRAWNDTGGKVVSAVHQHWRGVAQGAVNVAAGVGVGACVFFSGGVCAAAIPEVGCGVGALNNWIGGTSAQGIATGCAEGGLVGVGTLLCTVACGPVLLGAAADLLIGAGQGIYSYATSSTCRTFFGYLKAAANGAWNNVPIPYNRLFKSGSDG